MSTSEDLRRKREDLRKRREDLDADREEVSIKSLHTSAAEGMSVMFLMCFGILMYPALTQGVTLSDAILLYPWIVVTLTVTSVAALLMAVTSFFDTANDLNDVLTDGAVAVVKNNPSKTRSEQLSLLTEKMDYNLNNDPGLDPRENNLYKICVSIVVLSSPFTGSMGFFCLVLLVRYLIIPKWEKGVMNQGLKRAMKYARG